MKSLLSTCAAFALAGALFASAALAQQNYGNALGTSPYVPPYAANTGTSARTLPGYQYGAAPGYPNGQPVPPANKPYYSPPAAGSSMMPHNQGSSLGTSGTPYGYTTGHGYATGHPY